MEEQTQRTTDQQTTRNFNPNEHLVQLKSKQGSQDYLPVQWRLVWFRSECPHGTIETYEMEVDLDRIVESESYVWNAEKRRSEKVIKQAKGYARFRAVVTDGKGGSATGTGSEAAADFGDYIEKAETKAIGRALAALGYGTQFAPELTESHRIVDAPVDFSNGSNNQRNDTRTPASNEADTSATAQQIESIKKLCAHLGREVPDVTSFLNAKQHLHQLTAAYKEQREQSRVVS